MRNLIRLISTSLLEQKPATITALTLGIVAVLGFLDYWSGFEIAFSFFYLLPIAIAAWYVSFQAGVFVSVVSITIWLVSNRFAGEIYSHEAIRYWNAAIRLILFVSIASLLHNLKIALEHERTLSSTDFLTGIMNSREFHRLARLEILRSLRYQHPLTIAFLDLDNFKQINDDLGHSIGDILLRFVAQTLSKCLREIDYVARVGGDEFAILLPETDDNAARIVINKIQKAIEESCPPNLQKVTMSIGVVSYTQPPQTVDELLDQADTLMYEFKKTWQE